MHWKNGADPLEPKGFESDRPRQSEIVVDKNRLDKIICPLMKLLASHNHLEGPVSLPRVSGSLVVLYARVFIGPKDNGSILVQSASNQVVTHREPHGNKLGVVNLTDEWGRRNIIPV